MAANGRKRGRQGPKAGSSAEHADLLCDLESNDELVRAQAVRELCRCRTAWGVAVQRYAAKMTDDPSATVRHEAHHVMDEDSGWGRKLDARRMRNEIE